MPVKQNISGNLFPTQNTFDLHGRIRVAESNERRHTRTKCHN